MNKKDLDRTVRMLSLNLAFNYIKNFVLYVHVPTFSHILKTWICKGVFY